MPIRFKLRRTFAQSVRRFLRSRRGNIAALTALLIVPLAALLGMATEGGSWFLITRAMQNAADSAVIATATNGGNAVSGTDYVNEGKAIAASYGFVNGSNDATVTVPAPGNYATVTSCASSPCYQVKITKTVPLYLIPLVGFNGNTALGTTRGQQLSAVALATLKTVNAPFCLTALSSDPSAIDGRGIPSSNITCNIQSAGGTNCNPTHKLTSGYSDAVGDNSCGTKQHPVSGVTVTYDSLLSNIPSTSSCNGASYPNGNSKNKNQLSGTLSLGASKVYCGDVKLTGNVSVSAATGGSLLVIANGLLDLGNFKLQTPVGSPGLTIVFTSPTPGSYNYTSGGQVNNDSKGNNVIIGNGTLDISSPTSGTWSGMAVYQDRNLPEQTIEYAGNKPTWNISGIVYLPKTKLTAKGAIGKSASGFACLTLVVETLLMKGTGDLFYQNPQSQCAQQGVSSPTNQAYVVGALVR